MFKYLKVTFYLGLMLLMMSIFFMFGGFSFYMSGKVIFVEWELFSLSSMTMLMLLLFDWMSLSFMGFVLFISSMVMIYSASYMSLDKNIYRFVILVFLFVLSMLLMILSPNMISILLGWDGLGLISYCLVIYYQNVKSSSAGMLTILSNRVGDVAILLSIAWLGNYGSWNFFYLQSLWGSSELMLVLFLLILAGMTKSAQIPFSAWLPAAMAAPTPVSALVHSSTLVTAGVYLLIRFSFLLGSSDFLFFVGSFTMFMAGLGANFEMDLKSIIALSTLSQLGLMMMVLSLGMLELAFFHLLSHALFKSLLFLCAGGFIHGTEDMQDIRFMGSLNVMGSVSSLYFIGCSLSLCGFPFLSGFYSKDLILEMYMMGEMGLMMFLIIIVGTLFTVSYSLRLIYYLFFKNLGSKVYVMMSDDTVMIWPMTFLFIMVLAAGSSMTWFYFPCMTVSLPLAFSGLILIFCAITYIFTYFLMDSLSIFLVKLMSKILLYVSSMWFMPVLSTLIFLKFLKLGGYLVKNMDQGWVEYLGGQGLFNSISFFSNKFDIMYFLNLKFYLFIFLMITVYFFTI